MGRVKKLQSIFHLNYVYHNFQNWRGKKFELAWKKTRKLVWLTFFLVKPITVNQWKIDGKSMRNQYKIHKQSIKAQSIIICWLQNWFYFKIKLWLIFYYLRTLKILRLRKIVAYFWNRWNLYILLKNEYFKIDRSVSQKKMWNVLIKTIDKRHQKEIQHIQMQM